jgi:hypothetical protein
MVGKNGEITGTWCRATVLPGIKATPHPKMHLFFENEDAKKHRRRTQTMGLRKRRRTQRTQTCLIRPRQLGLRSNNIWDGDAHTNDHRQKNFTKKNLRLEESFKENVKPWNPSWNT